MPQKRDARPYFEFGQFVAGGGCLLNNSQIEPEKTPSRGKEHHMPQAAGTRREKLETHRCNYKHNRRQIVPVEKHLPAIDEHRTIKSRQRRLGLRPRLDYLRCLAIFCRYHQLLATGQASRRPASVFVGKGNERFALWAVELYRHCCFLSACIASVKLFRSLAHFFASRRSILSCFTSIARCLSIVVIFSSGLGPVLV